MARGGRERGVDRDGRLGARYTPMPIRVAATLRLPDLIAEAATTVEALAGRSGADPDALARLLRHLASIGLVTRDGGGLGLTELGEALRRDHPGSPAPSLDLDGVV